MAFDFSSLITDRGPGTFYNVSDLNRVEAACADLYQRFTDYGYLIPDYVPVVNHWTESKTPTVGQLGRDLTNITALRNTITALSTTPETPETMRFWDYLKANDIERILLAVEDTLRRLEKTFWYSGEIYSGESGGTT
uniref:Uncharacterized protein n=1 Tax=Siphoviridae sp. ctepM7 TaxID=2826408 RepID=A0A8S5N8J5_9CAUD|nr:MAG TPA: hypothetical protein [Siphoviridae sp. ctepM7]